MRAVCLVFVAILFSPAHAWATDWHVCPDVDGAGTDINYGAEDGTSEADCFDGVADAWATAGDIDAGDTVYFHGTFYHEHIYTADSGTAGNMITLNLTDALSWMSNDVSGVLTSANASPFGQGTGTSWQLVSGNIYKKGSGTRPYMMWVNGVRVPNANTAVATQNDAGAVAVLTTDGTYTSTSEDLDGFNNTLYYRGTPTADMRVNRQEAYSLAYAHGGIVSYEFDYIAFVSPSVRGYRVNLEEVGGLYIQGCTGCTVTDPILYENMQGARFNSNATLLVSGDDCAISDNVSTGVGIQGAYILVSTAGLPQQVDQISQANPGLVTTNMNHGVITGDVIVMESVTGMTQVNGVEYTATYVSDTTFTIGVDTTAFGAYTNNSGVLWIKKTASGGVDGMTFDCGTPYASGSGVYENGNGPNFSAGTTPTWNLDDDGIGIGYYGGRMNNISITGSRIVDNGPRRDLVGGEAGSTQRGSGIFMGTTYANSTNALVVRGNQFEGNHRVNFNATDAISFNVSGNIFGDLVNYDATSATYGHIRILGYNGATDYRISHNVILGASGSYVFGLTNDHASQVWNVSNNAVGAVTEDPLGAWEGIFDLSTTTATVTDRENRFISAPGDAFYKRSSTTYTTVAAWDTAISQTTGDEIITDMGWVGGAVPVTANEFKLKTTSTLLRSGHELNRGNVQDFNNRAFLHPPSIGAFENTIAATRAARQ